jgi:hypothetical protein
MLIMVLLAVAYGTGLEICRRLIDAKCKATKKCSEND